MNSQLQSKAVKALGHLGLGGLLSKIISLGSTLILARLLSPGDYGLMSIAMVIISFVGYFNEVGIGAAIVQKPNLTTSEVNGCFAVALLLSTTLFILTAACSGLLANFFGNPQLQPMIAVLASAFVLGAFSTVPQAFLRKEMHFGAVASINILGVVVQCLVCLALAYTGHGVWSLVFGFIASSIVQACGSFWLSSWRPRGAFSIREAATLVFYGLHVTKSRIFWYLYTNADKVIIEKLLGAKSLGVYDMAFSLATLPTGQVTTLVTNVAGPLFAKLQNDHDALNAVLLKFTRGAAYITYPALIGMLACSHELVMVALGVKWMDVLIPFAALCLMGLIKSVDPLLSQVLISTGHAKKLANYTATCAVAMSLAVVVGAKLDGLRGVSIVWIAVYPLLSIKLLTDTCRVTGMRRLAYYRNLLPVLAGSLIMGAAVLVIRESLLQFRQSAGFMLGTEVIGGAVAYFLWLAFVDRRSMTEIRQVMIDLGISENRLNRWPFVRGATMAE